MASTRNVMTAADDDGDGTEVLAPVEQQAPTDSAAPVNDDAAADQQAPQNQQVITSTHQPRDGEIVPDYDIVIDDGTDQDQDGAQPEDRAANTQADRRRQEPAPGAHESRSSRRMRQRAAKERTTAELSRTYAEIDNLRQQLAEVTQRYGTVEPRLNELTEANLRSQREGLESKVADAERRHAALEDEYWSAIESGDMARARQIDRDRQNAFVTKTKLGMAVENFDQLVKQRQSRSPAAGDEDRDPPRQTEQRQAPQRQQQAPSVSPVATRLAKDFIDGDAPWYNSPGSELDSSILTAIETSVGNSGLNPETEAFWDRVYDLATERLPHRFAADDTAAARQPAPRPQAARQAPPVRRGPPTGAPSTSRSAGGNKNVFRLTPERAKAAFQAGYIDENNKPIDRAKFFQVASQWAAEDRAALRTGR